MDGLDKDARLEAERLAAAAERVRTVRLNVAFPLRVVAPDPAFFRSPAASEQTRIPPATSPVPE
jgi:hypothetical protein